MKVDVVLISNETIKPSSPTPHHLRNFNLSLLDQFSSPNYVPIILFYNAAPLDGCSNRLKRSLSDSLTRFYPVAGRVKCNVSVDCNDEGVDYMETRVDGKMSDFMIRPDLHHHLLPIHIVSSIMARDALLAVQVNVFDCGGIAISVSMSHKIADASAMTTFINHWAATTRGSTKIMGPTFESASLFPAREILKTPPDTTGTGTPNNSSTTKGHVKKSVLKRFVFDASMITTLRAKIQDTTSTSVRKCPTRVEAVSALIWKSLMEVSKVKFESSSLTKPLKCMVVHHIVNLRKRMDPQLPDMSFGNMITPVTAVAPSTMVMSQEVELEELVGKLRAAISKINSGDYIKKLQGDDDDEEINRLFKESRYYVKEVDINNDDNKDDEDEDDNEDDNVYWMSSWCRLPLYESDFGWGKPNFICTNKAYKNVIILMDTRCGDGIEAWVGLAEDDMSIFERDPQLIQFVSTI